MLKLFLVVSCSLYLVSSFGEAVTCYHCFDSFYPPTVAGSVNGSTYGEKFVRCDKNRLKWNTWTCPPKWPICVVMYGKVINHYEVVRTCAENNFCSGYVPPPGVKVTSCRECNTTMCNDYEQIDPPVDPAPLFTFNININLNINKYTLTGGEEEKQNK